MTVINTEILRLQCKRFADFTINVNDATLQGSLITTLLFRSDDECRFACMMDVQCKSYNKEIKGDERCELNRKTTEIKEDEATLVRRPGWIFKSTNYSDPLVRRLIACTTLKQSDKNIHLGQNSCIMSSEEHRFTNRNLGMIREEL